MSAIATRDKTSMLCLRIFVLITLRTILNAIICCLQLNTGGGADANPKVDYLGIDACWIAVYVLCRNALIKSLVIIVDMYWIFICQLPNVICSPSMLVILLERHH